MENVGVRMFKEKLCCIPQFDFPDGFSIRRYREGDEEDWVRIHKAADALIEYNIDRFWSEFGTDKSLLADRQMYICDESDTPIGTATAWFKKDEGSPEIGLVHWVAIVPEAQGKGLSKPLMTAICNRFVEFGYDRAHLVTSTARIPAISLYFKFGFYPEIRTEEDIRAWRLVMEALNMNHIGGFVFP